MSIEIGQRLPSGTLHGDNPRDHVDALEALGTGRVLVFGVPGAFTPGCNTHLPTYIEAHDALKAKGIDQVVCLAVNDAHVTREWGKAMGAGGKVRILADPACDYTKALGLEVDASVFFGNVRSRRYAMVVQDGTVTHLQVEPDNFGLSCSLAPSILELL